MLSTPKCRPGNGGAKAAASHLPTQRLPVQDRPETSVSCSAATGFVIGLMKDLSCLQFVVCVFVGLLWGSSWCCVGFMYLLASYGSCFALGVSAGPTITRFPRVGPCSIRVAGLDLLLVSSSFLEA